jgi:hypothetical protein
MWLSRFLTYDNGLQCDGMVMMIHRFCGPCHRRRTCFSCGNFGDNRKWCALPVIYADFAAALQDSRQNKINTTLQQQQGNILVKQLM